MSSLSISLINNGGGGGGMLNTLTGNSGGAVSPDAFKNINILGDGTYLDVVGDPGLNTLTISFVGSTAESFLTDDTNSAVPTAGVINIAGGNTVAHKNINTTSPGTGNQVFIALNESILLPATTGANVGVIGLGTSLTTNRFVHNYGTNNTFVGTESGNFTTTGDGANAAFGTASLLGLTTGSFNTAIGATAGINLTSGNANLLLGNGTGVNYDTQSNNVLLANSGINTDANVIRIGTQGSGAGQQNKVFVAGIYNTATTSTPLAASVVNVGADGQLGNVKFTSLDSTVIFTQTNNGHLDFSSPGGGGGGGIFSLIPDSGPTATATNILIAGDGLYTDTNGFGGDTIGIQLVHNGLTIASGNSITVTNGSPVNLGGTATVNVSGTVDNAVQIGNPSGSLTNVTPDNTAGYVLTSNSPGAPSWKAVPSGGVAAMPFNYYLGTSINPGTGPRAFYLGDTVILTKLYDVGSNVYPGSGAGGHATFTAPFDGYYNLSFTGSFVGDSHTILNYSVSMGGAGLFFSEIVTFSAIAATGLSLAQSVTVSGIFPLNATQTVTFNIGTNCSSGGSMTIINGQGNTWIQGFRIL